MTTRHPTRADTTDLIAWADRLDAQSTLPRLVRRLILASTTGLTRVSFRAGEGVQIGGWDGVTENGAAHAFVPAGTAGWELSTRKGVKEKANEDYASRLKDPEGLDPAETTFIYVTPRRWGGKRDWVNERRADGHWKIVIAYDADDLETWLEAAPAVHLWLSIVMGKPSEEAIDLDNFWADWSHVTSPPLTSGFLLAGREKAVEEIYQHLQSPAESFAVAAESEGEALAILAAVVHALPEPEREPYLARIVVAQTPSGLERLAAMDVPLILVPVFEDAERISRAVRRRHHVIVPVAATHSETATTVNVPRLSPSKAEQELVASGIPKDTARELAHLGRRSLMALRRRLARRPEVQRPLWARPEHASDILPLFLAGGWNDASPGDAAALGNLAQMEPERVQELAARWARMGDPPARSVGSVFYLTSKADSWELLAQSLTKTYLNRLEEAVLAVLGAKDPRCDMSADERWLSLEGSKYSSYLRQGLAETLSIMGARGEGLEVAGVPLAQWAGRIVRRLLEQANTDWRVWASISRQLSDLAEAAPDAFLDAVEQGLMRDQPILKLFRDKGPSSFGSSPHTGLLSALERLAWSAEHLARASLALAKLARFDPGGKLANRPRASLRETFLLWYPQTAAPWDRQLQVLAMLLEHEPDAAWQLYADLLPRSHDASMTRTRPQWRWRDLAPEKALVPTIPEQIRRIRDVVTQILGVVGVSGRRWSLLIEALPNLPGDVYDMVVERLEKIDPATLTSEDRTAIWGALRHLVARHRSLPDAEWALPKDRVDKLGALYERHQPDDLFARFEWLFGDQVILPTGRKDDWQATAKAVAEERRKAVTAIHAESGTSGVEALIGRVANPFHLGIAFGESKLAVTDEDDLLLRHLGATDQALRNFARGLVVGRREVLGESWAQQKFQQQDLTPTQRAEILLCFPSEPSTWQLAGSDPAIDEAYWKQAFPYVKASSDEVEYLARRLIRYGRAFAAAEELAMRLTDPAPPSPELIADALEAVLTQKTEDGHSNSFTHWVRMLMDSLVSSGFDKSRVARIEWGFAGLLSRELPLRVLHAELARDPAFFVELLMVAYAEESEEAKEFSEAEQTRATAAYHVLDSWKSLPGTSLDGTVDPTALRAWVDAVLASAASNGRSSSGAQAVGKVLSHGPGGADGAWPHEAVRDVIDRLQNPDIDREFEIGKFNSRGVVTRSLDAGGMQDRELADQYARWARQITDRWPRTAAVLRRLEGTYRQEARRQDAQADLHNEGLR